MHTRLAYLIFSHCRCQIHGKGAAKLQTTRTEYEKQGPKKMGLRAEASSKTVTRMRHHNLCCHHHSRKRAKICLCIFHPSVAKGVVERQAAGQRRVWKGSYTADTSSKHCRERDSCNSLFYSSKWKTNSASSQSAQILGVRIGCAFVRPNNVPRLRLHASADVYRSYKTPIGVTSAESREERVHYPRQEERKSAKVNDNAKSMTEQSLMV